MKRLQALAKRDPELAEALEVLAHEVTASAIHEMKIAEKLARKAQSSSDPVDHALYVTDILSRLAGVLMYTKLPGGETFQKEQRAIKQIMDRIHKMVDPYI